MKGTCATCGSALHSDLSRFHGRCGPCRSGEDAAAEPDWRRLVAPVRTTPERPAETPEKTARS